MKSVEYIHLTNQCNLNCHHCNNISVEMEPQFPQLSHLNSVPVVVIQGGEPFLSSELFNTLQQLHSLNKKTIIKTNGTLVSGKKIQKVLSFFPNTELHITLDAHNEKLFQSITQTEYFPYVLKGIRTCLGNKIKVKVYHTVMAANYKYLQEFVELMDTTFGNRISIVFQLYIAKENKANTQNSLISFSSVKAYLMKAIDYCVLKNIDVEIENENGFPLCGLDEDYRVYFSTFKALHPNPNKKKIGDPLVKKTECQRCYFNHICPGLSENYVQQFGLDVIHPFRLDSGLSLPKVDCDISVKDLQPYQKAFEDRCRLTTDRGQYFVWALTGKCNLHCHFCNQRQYFRSDTYEELNFTQTMALIKSLSKWRFDNVLLCGGEPTLHQNLVPIVEQLSNQSIFSSLNTNGLLLSEPLLKDLNTAGLGTIILSVDSGVPALHNDLRNKEGLFESITKSLEYVANQDFKYKIHFHAVLNSQNYQSIETLIDFAAKMKVGHLDITMFMDVIKNDDHFRLSRENIIDFLKHYLPNLVLKAMEKSIKLHIIPLPLFLSILLPELTKEDFSLIQEMKINDEMLFDWANCEYNNELNRHYFCLSSWYDKFMDPFGNIHPCSQASTFHSKYIIGNIQEHSFDEIMNHTKLKDFRQKVPHHLCCKKCFALISLHQEIIKFVPLYQDTISSISYFKDNINSVFQKMIQ